MVDKFNTFTDEALQVETKKT
ncbi:Protein of unknown function [Bacillus mycoides]|nr:Protein of unknown function [Bacillus mycoides]